MSDNKMPDEIDKGYSTQELLNLTDEEMRAVNKIVKLENKLKESVPISELEKLIDEYKKEKPHYNKCLEDLEKLLKE